MCPKKRLLEEKKGIFEMNYGLQLKPFVIFTFKKIRNERGKMEAGVVRSPSNTVRVSVIIPPKLYKFITKKKKHDSA